METPIETIVKTTGLPSEIWPVIPPLQAPGSGVVGYTLKQRFPDRLEPVGNLKCIQLHDRTIYSLRSLPVAHILGQGVLVRTGADFTAMISIAEAAYVLLGKVFSDLLWVLLEAAEQELRADAANEQRQGVYIGWKKEISLAEYVANRHSRREFESSKIAQQIAEIKLEQKMLAEKIDGIQEQNKQILHLLTEFFQSSNKAGTTLPSTPKEVKDKFGGLAPSTAESSNKASTMKHYSTQVLFRKRDKKWFVCVYDLEAELSFLADWLEVALGGREFNTSSSLLSNCNRLEDDGQFIRREYPELHGCWRKKIVSGIILGPSPGKATGEISYGNRGLPHPFPQCKDGLVLSAAALWSLFDNALQRVPHCKCTFTAKSGGFIQCKGKSGKWLLWHTSSEELPCDGQRCEANVCVALTPEELGERIYTTSPCVLGWAAQSRAKPDSPLWETLSTTKEFRNKVLTKYKVNEFRALAQLSAPVAISPQIGGAITFSKKSYKVANSIDHASILAMEIAAATVVLIFDERRGFHISCDGADIIEMLCLQYLRNMYHDASHFPPFTHTTALQRLGTWYQSSFVSPTGTYITGDHLVREASGKMSQLAELTKNAAAKGDSVLLYWLLEDVLKGTVGMAIKAPQTRHDSWHKLAFEYPPLIFAVGEVNAKLITVNDSPLRWIRSNSSDIRTSLTEWGRHLSCPEQGGIIGSQGQIKRWLTQAQSFYRATLHQTKNRVVFGDTEMDSEYTYKVDECGQEVVPDGVFTSCQDCQKIVRDVACITSNKSNSGCYLCEWHDK
jgi:hypothetical protein